MTRKAISSGAVALTVAMLGSIAARANPPYTESMPPPSAYPAKSGQRANWHYEWRYHDTRHGEWALGWVAVPNSR